LNHLPGAETTVAVDLNDSIYTNNDNIPDGHVIGNSGNFIKADVDAFLKDSYLSADDGTTLAELGDVQGFFWDGGAMYPINHLGGGTSVAADLNNKDQVVGGALTAEGATHAFLWTLGADKKGIIKDLGTLGGTNSMALAINESGQVVGWSETGDFYEEQGVLLPIRHGFLWDNGTMSDLGTHDDFYDFPFKPPYPFSEAVDINESGDLTGNSITINDHSRGFYLQPEAPIP
jgi:probable HAF family extracellular repeat protein